MSVSSSSNVNSDKYYLTFVSDAGAGDCNNIRYNIQPFFQRLKKPTQRFRIKVLTFQFDDNVSGTIPDMTAICIKEFNADNFYIKSGIVPQNDDTIQLIPQQLGGNHYAFVEGGDDGGVVGYLSGLQTMTVQFRDPFANSIPQLLGHDYVLRIMIKPIPDESPFSSSTL